MHIRTKAKTQSVAAFSLTDIAPGTHRSSTTTTFCTTRTTGLFLKPAKVSTTLTGDQIGCIDSPAIPTPPGHTERSPRPLV
jgi:hypothetical protein